MPKQRGRRRKWVMRNKLGETIEAAAQALSDLNTFAVIVSIVEGGHLHAPSYAGGARIIKICRAEEAKRLREYDRAIAKAGGGTYGR